MKFLLSALIVVALAVATTALNDARRKLKQGFGQVFSCQYSFDCVDLCSLSALQPVEAQCLFYPPVGDQVCACVPVKYEGAKKRRGRSVDLTPPTKLTTKLTVD